MSAITQEQKQHIQTIAETMAPFLQAAISEGVFRGQNDILRKQEKVKPATIPTRAINEPDPEHSRMEQILWCEVVANLTANNARAYDNAGVTYDPMRVVENAAGFADLAVQQFNKRFPK